MKCPYCSGQAQVVGGDTIYPHRPDLAHKKFHLCEPCNAYVGCHEAGSYSYVKGKRVVSDGTLPLGRLANQSLREAKQRAHAAFDPLWKSGDRTRKQAYGWLAIRMGLSVDDTHIGMLDEDQCDLVVAFCNNASF